MNYILCDTPNIEKFYPFTLTRPLGEMRVFGGTLKELWEKKLGCKVSYFTRDYLIDLYPVKFEKKNIILHPLGILDSQFDKQIDFDYDADEPLDKLVELIQNNYLDKNNSFKLSSFLSNYIRPFIKIDYSGSRLDCSDNDLLNDDDGPIIVEDDVTIMEGAMIRGPVYIGQGSVIKMGAKIYGPVVIGPYCKLGGEISHCVFLGYSNKAHDGFLGHSIIGEWCNIGAGTSNSNLKNDYSYVKMWDYSVKSFKETEEQFLGLYMGDHSKCAINTSFNTGTTIGVNCNIFGAGFPRNFIPSFSWGGAQGIRPYKFSKAVAVAKKVMLRRNINIEEKYIKMLQFVHDITLTMK